jgi:hypothetical protein
MKVFSFCLYGNKPKYITGMHENIKIISGVFPDWKIIIYYEEETTYIKPFELYSNVILRKGQYTGNQMMLDRFKPIDDPEVEIMLVRDADSRINERDEWCIREFIKSPKLFHIIRDHPYHVHSLILGGLWGMKKGIFPRFLKIGRMAEVYSFEHPNVQGFDQRFLSEIIYPKIWSSSLIHGSIRMHENEKVIPIPITSEHMFCGQVIEYNDEGLEYHNCDDCRALQ